MPISTARERTINEHLRHQLEIRRELRQAFAGMTHRRKNLQSAHDAVARGLSVECEQMPRCFAAQNPTALEQHLKHVSIPYFGSTERNTELIEPFFQSVVGHERSGYARHHAFRKAVADHHIEQLVTGINPSVSVSHDETVCVPVKAHRHLTARGPALLRQMLGVCRPDAAIDVEAVWRIADRDHIGAKLMKDIRRNVIGRTIGAVDEDLQAL